MSMHDYRIEDATRASLCGVINRFNTEEAFWRDFVPDPDSAWLSEKEFGVTLSGRGVCLEVRGLTHEDEVGHLQPKLEVSARPSPTSSEHGRWYSIGAVLDKRGCFITSNFRAAIEAAIDELRAATPSQSMRS